MASYLVSGAGDASYNGIYAEVGTYSSEPYYQNSSGMLLFYQGYPYGLGDHLTTGSDVAYYLFPSGAGDPTGTYTVSGGTAPAPTVTLYSGPAITGFAPAAGPVGTDVVITGSGFTGATAVRFNGAAATLWRVDSDTQITARVPSGATTGRITVAVTSGTLTSSTDFTVTGGGGSGTTERHLHASILVTAPDGTSPDRIYNFGGTTNYNNLESVTDSIEHAIVTGGVPGDFADSGQVLLTARASHSVSRHGNYLYVVGGSDATVSRVTAIERIPINSDGSLGMPVTQSAILVHSRYAHAAVVLSDYLYVAGGQDGVTNRTIERSLIDGSGNLGAFAVQSQVLTSPPFSGTGRAGAASFVTATAWWLAGGTTDSSRVERIPYTGGAIGTPASTTHAGLTNDASQAHDWAAILSGRVILAGPGSFGYRPKYINVVSNEMSGDFGALTPLSTVALHSTVVSTGSRVYRIGGNTTDPGYAYPSSVYIEEIAVDLTAPTVSGLVQSSPTGWKVPYFTWVFSDADLGDVQSAYQLRIVDGSSVEVYNSGKAISSSQGPRPASSLPVGTYTAYLKVWDSTGLVSSEISHAVSITNAAPSVGILSRTSDPSDPKPAFHWRFDDTDGDYETAFRVRILSGATVVYSSGKLLANVQQFTTPDADALSPGAYTVKVIVWDTVDVPSAETSLDFTITAAGANTAPTAPTLAITGGTPTANNTPAFTVVPHDPDPGDSMTKLLRWVTRDSDGQLIWGSSSTAVDAAGALEAAFPVPTDVPLASGAYVFHAATFDAFNAPSPISTLPFSVSAAADLTPPVVAWVAPADGAIVSGQVRLVASASDNVAVTAVQFYVDGQPVGSALTAPNYQGHYYVLWDSQAIAWANGTRTLKVTATDAAGNSASASITVSLQNSLANLRRVLYTKQLPAGALVPAFWPVDGHLLSKVLVSAVPDIVEPDPESNYNFRLLIHTPGDTLDTTKYQLLTNRRSGLVNPQAATFRLAIEAVPGQVTTRFLTGQTSIIRLHPYNDGADKVGLLTRNAQAIYVFNGSAVSLVTNLSGLTDYIVNDFAYLSGRWYVALESTTGARPVLRVYHSPPYTNERAWDLTLSDDDSAIPRALAVWNGKLWVGTDDGLATSASGRLLTLDSAFTLSTVDDTVSGIARLFPATALRAASSDGKLYDVTEAGGAVLLFDSLETNSHALFDDGVVVSFGAGDAGRLYSNRAGGFGLETAFAFTQALAVSNYNGSPYAGGDSPFLMRRTLGAWSTVDELVGITRINDMAAYAGGLLMATAPHGELWRREANVVSNAITARYLRAAGAVAVEVKE